MNVSDVNIYNVDDWLDYMIEYNQDDLKEIISSGDDSETILDYITLIRCLCPRYFSPLIAIKEESLITKDKYLNDNSGCICSNRMCDYKKMYN